MLQEFLVYYCLFLRRAFLSILLIAGLNELTTPSIQLQILLPPFGAAAVVMFGVPDAKLSQPRNCFVGQVGRGFHRYA